MIVALTLRQWRNLVEATGLGEAFDAIARLMDVDLDEEGGRFAAREVLGATLKPWVLARTLEEVRETFDRHGVVLGPLPDVHASWSSAIRAARPQNPMFEEVEQPGIGTYLVPGSPLAFSDAERLHRRPRRCSASTPTRCSPACSASATARSARCTTWRRGRPGAGAT